MSTRPLYIPKDKRQFGLKIDCGECGTLVTDVCKKSCSALENCKFGHKHSFKVIVYEPNSGKRRTKNLETRDYKEAIIEAAIFQKEVKAEKQKEIINKEEPIQASTQSAPLLIESMAKYMAFMHGAESIPEMKRRARSTAHCKQVERTFLQFVKCQKDNYDIKKITIEQVNSDMTNRFHSFILSRKLSGRNYDLTMGTMSTFYNHLLKEGKAKVNPFLGFVRRTIQANKINVLTSKEYEAILKVYENPELFKRSVGKEKKDYYRSWVSPAIKIALMSGRRGEELIKSKWSDIETDENNQMQSLTVIDYKVSRQQNRLETNPKRISVPITEEFKNVLMELGYEKLKESEQYIIGNEETMDRHTMKIFLGRSFSHAWGQTEFSKNKKASFKILRKCYLSALSAAIGISNARVISQHSDTKILQTNYVSAEILGLTAKNFSVFSKTEERQAELNKLRQSHNGLSLEK